MTLNGCRCGHENVCPTECRANTFEWTRTARTSHPEQRNLNICIGSFISECSREPFNRQSVWYHLLISCKVDQRANLMSWKKTCIHCGLAMHYNVWWQCVCRHVTWYTVHCMYANQRCLAMASFDPQHQNHNYYWRRRPISIILIHANQVWFGTNHCVK